MKRRNSKTDADRNAWLPGETWGERLRRIYPKGCAAAERRLDREILVEAWPRVAETKAVYHRRTRSRRRR